jgi:hypothetical protein
MAGQKLLSILILIGALIVIRVVQEAVPSPWKDWIEIL